jgi:uncharacterized protein YnzC (UPF0291/DUF896 family)
MQAARLQLLKPHEKVQQIPLLKVISQQHLQLANKIGGMILQVYNDAKSLTLSAFSWPARMVTSQMASNFNMNAAFTEYKPSDFDLQYINPLTHQELLHTIVKADIPQFKEEMKLAFASSFRCDSSMDRVQMDNQFQLVKIIDQKGNESTKFIGIGHVTEPGAEGHLKAIKEGANETVGFDFLINSITHLSTDGENKNVGQHRGLWKLLDDERKGSTLPLLKTVCAVHSSALAYKDLCGQIPDINSLTSQMSGLSAFFHSSARRSNDLSRIAEERGLSLLHLPQYFDIRWSEFTAKLFHNILVSWRALVAYFESSNADQKFGKLLTNKSNLELLCFLADLLFILQNFQKKLQSDTITIVDLQPELQKFVAKLETLKERPILGGWEEEFKKEYSENESKFCGLTLWTKEKRCQNRNLFVSEKRDFSAVRFECLEGMQNFMKKRLQVQDIAVDSLSRMVKLTASEDDIRLVHKQIAPDLDICQLAQEYQDVQVRIYFLNSITIRFTCFTVCAEQPRDIQ